MPDKKRYITLVGEDQKYWTQEEWEKGGKSFMDANPDAVLWEEDDYNPEDVQEGDQYFQDGKEVDNPNRIVQAAPQQKAAVDVKTPDFEKAKKFSVMDRIDPIGSAMNINVQDYSSQPKVEQQTGQGFQLNPELQGKSPVKRVRQVNYWESDAASTKSRIDEIDELLASEAAVAGGNEDYESSVDYDALRKERDDLQARYDANPTIVEQKEWDDLHSAEGFQKAKDTAKSAKDAYDKVLTKKNLEIGQIPGWLPKDEQQAKRQAIDEKYAPELETLRKAYNDARNAEMTHPYGKAVAEYEKNYFPNLRKQITDWKAKDVDALTAAKGASKKHNYGAGPHSDVSIWMAAFEGLSGEDVAEQYLEASEEERYNSALAFLDKAERIRKEYSSFGEGVKNIAMNEVESWGTQSDLETYTEIYTILSGLEKKLGSLNDVSEADITSNLSRSEQALILAFFEYNAAMQEVEGKQTAAYKGGQIAGEMVPFMLEFIVTGGITKAAGSGLTKAFKEWVEGAAEGTIKRKVRSAAAGTAKFLGKGAAMTALRPSAYEAVAEAGTVIKDDGSLATGKDYLKAGVDQLIETYSEMIGGKLEDLWGWATKSFGNSRVAKWFGDTAFADYAKEFAKRPVVQKINAGVKASRKVLGQFGVQGTVYEGLEEVAGALAREATIDNKALDHMFEGNNFNAMLIGFSVMPVLGGTIGVSSMPYANWKRAQIAENLRMSLQPNMSEAQVNHLFSRINSAKTPSEMKEAVKPIVHQMVKSGATAEEISLVWEYAGFEAAWKTLLFEKEYDDKGIADAKLAEAETEYGEFWVKDGNAAPAEAEMTEEQKAAVNAARKVRIAKLNDGRTVFILSEPNEQGEVPIIDMQTKKKGAAKIEDIATRQDSRGNVVKLDNTWTMDQFVTTQVLKDRKDAEKERMTAERDAQIEALKVQVQQDQVINVGTTEQPNEVPVKAINDNGVTYVDANGNEVALTWEQVGNALHKPIEVLTDAQIAAKETEELIKMDAERMSRRAPRKAETAEATAKELDEKLKNIPKNPDGSVDETSFWELDPEGYAEWNDTLNNDGGKDTREQIAISRKELEARMKELDKESKTSDPMKRKAAKIKKNAVNERLAKIVGLEMKYKVQSRIDAWENALGKGRITRLYTPEQLAAVDKEAVEQMKSGKRVRGFAKGSNAYVYMPGILSAEEYDEVFIHEVLSHLGLRELLGEEDYNKMLDEVWASMSETDRQVFSTYANAGKATGLQRQRIAADEYIAHIAEKMDSQELLPEEKTIWQKIVDFVKNIFRSKGITVDESQDGEAPMMTEQMIHEKIKESFANLSSKKGQPLTASISGSRKSMVEEPSAARQEYDALLSDLTPEEIRMVAGNDLAAAQEAYDALASSQPAVEPGESSKAFIERKRAYNEQLEAAKAELDARQALMDEIAAIEAENAPVLTDAEVLEQDGLGVDAQNDDVRMSVRYIPTEKQRENIIGSIMNVTGRTREEAERWLASETSLAAMINEDLQYLDYVADPKYKAIKDNSDYPQGTVDFNNICRKRLPFTRMFTRLQRRFPNRVFTAEELADIRTIMSQDDLMVACGLCYVEDRRQMVGEVAQSFIDGIQEGFNTYANNPTKTKNAEKFKALIGEDTYVPQVYDLTTQEGLDKLYNEHRGIWEAFQAFNNARGQQSQNLLQGYAEYKREILSWSDKKVKSVNDNGGLRIFSYSDFEAHHLIDVVQIIIDCAAKGVKIQGYTKVPEFARAVANTGIKLNRSLIPLGDTGIVDGQLAFDPVEGIDVNDPNFLESNDNVGNILIGINDEQIRMAMKAPFVHYIIPYHARQKENIRQKLNVGAWTNYISTQNERNISDGKRVKDNINIYTDILTEDITTDRQFVEKYLQLCAEQGRIPKFDQFLNKDAEGNYIYTPGYYKFLVDFKLFDENGNILPQQPVVAEFDDAFNMQILEDYVKGERESTGDQMNETYDKIVEALGLDESAAQGEEVRFSAKEKSLDTDAGKLRGNTKASIVSSEVLANIEQLKENYKRSDRSNRTKGFVSLLVRALGIDPNAPSFYKTFSTPKGDITLRISNHNASVSWFDEKGEKEGLSIVISRYKNLGIKKNGTAHVVEYFYPKQRLDKAEQNPMASIVESIEALLKTGDFVDMSGLAYKDEANGNTLFSAVITPQMDADYIAVVERGDMETAKRMVNEAAKLAMPNTKVVDENGNPKVVYHGTNLSAANKGVPFWTFYEDQHFGTKAQAEEMARAGMPDSVRKVYSVFINVPNIKRVKDAPQDWIKTHSEYWEPIFDEAKQEGYDGLVYVNEWEDSDNKNDSYVVFSPSQIKSAEPVTYDDAGNVIPLSERFNPEKSDIRFSARTDEQRQALFDKAKAQFGLTNNFNAAGYMLPDGSLLDFSEANDGGNPNQRSQDHREIEGIIMDEGIEYDSRWMYLADFMNEGAIRLLPEYAGINLMKAPTKEQRQRLFDFIYKYNGEVILEIADERLNNVAYVEYDRRTSPSRIFRDIDGYFNEGIVPQQDTRFSVIGERGAAADKTPEGVTRFANLGVARQMESQLNPDWSAKESEAALKIKMATGWERGADGKWRYETSDIQMKPIEDWLFNNKKMTLKDIVEPGMLLQLYPELGDVVIKKSKSVTDNGAWYNDATNEMQLPFALMKRAHEIAETDDAWKKKFDRWTNDLWHDIIHETQHYIQNKEEFARGGNESIVIDPAARAMIEEFLTEMDKFANVYNSLSASDKGQSYGKFLAGQYNAYSKKVQDIMKKFGIGTEGYMKLGGEVESRNMEKRSDMPLDERRNTLLSSTEDVSREDQILIDNDFNIMNSEIRFSIANADQTIFVSNAAKAVEDIKQEKATPAQWLAMLEKAGGLKAGEDKWMGLSDWLKESDKKTLTKAEVLEFVNEHAIKIEETHYLEDIDFNEEEQKQIDAMNEEFLALRSEAEAGGEWIHDAAEIAYQVMANKYGDDFTIGFGVDMGKLYVSNLEAASAITGIAPREERVINEIRLNYTTGDLTNRHEIALTVPTIESWNESDDTHFGDAGDGRAVAWIRFGDTYLPVEKDYQAAYDAAREEYKALESSLKQKYNGAALVDVMTVEEKRALWDAFEKRTQAQGELLNPPQSDTKVLVIDEIQSKRHQEGRERGYMPIGIRNVQLRMQEIEERLEELGRIESESDFGLTDEQYDEQILLLAEQKELVKSGTIPDAPFEKNWHELAMKRMLRYAAENGYDVIAWTKGDQQAERYGIGGAVESISSTSTTYGENPAKEIYIEFKNQEFTIYVDTNGNVVDHGEYEGRNLGEIVGKELAEKLLAEDTTLSGDGLRIGGEGMKGFYDKMLPAFMNKYGKKWGVKVEDINLPNLEDGLTMHSVPVTEEMKASVMEGQTMFSVRTPAENKYTKEHLPNYMFDTDVRFSLSKNNRQTISGWLNKRGDLTEEVKTEVLDLLDQYNDATLQLCMGKWFAQGVISLPEDIDKCIQAVASAKKAKVNALSYPSPMSIIDQHGVIEKKQKPIDPDTVSTLKKSKVMDDGVVLYDVEESEESRQNLREIINTHYGANSSPWCLLQGDENGKLTEKSAGFWNEYSAVPKRVAFKDGKLLAFYASRSNQTTPWWDRFDRPWEGVPVSSKDKNDPLKREITRLVDDKTGKAGDEVSIIREEKFSDGSRAVAEWASMDPNDIRSYEKKTSSGRVTAGFEYQRALAEPGNPAFRFFANVFNRAIPKRLSWVSHNGESVQMDSMLGLTEYSMNDVSIDYTGDNISVVQVENYEENGEPRKYAKIYYDFSKSGNLVEVGVRDEQKEWVIITDKEELAQYEEQARPYFDIAKSAMEDPYKKMEEIKERILDEAGLRFSVSLKPEVRHEMDAILATAIVDGQYERSAEGMHMLAPNGKRSNLDMDTWALVRTKNFINWFGDWLNDPENASKVVDENGEPMVVYHGTAGNIDRFENQQRSPGFWFVNREDVANGYAESASAEFEKEQNVVPVFLNIRNPRMEDAYGEYPTEFALKSYVENDNGVYEVFDTYEEAEAYRKQYVPDGWVGAHEVGDQHDLVERAMELGYDGVIMKNMHDQAAYADTRVKGTQTNYVALNSNQIKSATETTGEFSESEDIRFSAVTEAEERTLFSIRTKPAPEKTGTGYKVFYLKDGKLYPPMVANLGGIDTPVGVWLDADAAPVAGQSKTGRTQVKAGGKGTQGGGGTLAYRPGWHLGEIPYALQFNRKDENGEKTLFPANFVWAEVEYADDVNYQEEAMSYGMNANGKFQHSLAGLPKVPTDGSYRYRTNPNPATDPWIITGAMKVKRLLTPSEVDQMVIEAGREPQKRQEGAVTDEQINALNKELGLSAPADNTRFSAISTPTDNVVAEGMKFSVQDFARLAGNIFQDMPEPFRKEVIEESHKNGWDMQSAIYQIPARLAEKENWDETDRGLAKVIREKVQDALDETGVVTDRPITTKEALWMLYRASNPTSDDILDAARMSVVAHNLGFDPNSVRVKDEANDYIRFSAVEDDFLDSATEMYNYETSLWFERVKESWIDMNKSVIALQDAMAEASGKPIEAWENIDYALNQLSSKSYADKKKYMRDFLKPLWDVVIKMAKADDLSIEDIERYMMLKHGLERNKVFAQRDAKAFYKAMFDVVADRMKTQSHAQQTVALSEAKKSLSEIDALIKKAKAKKAKAKKLKELEEAKAKAQMEVEIAELVLRGDEEQNDADLRAKYAAIEAGTDAKYLEYREKDYGGLTGLFTEVDVEAVGKRGKYKTEEAYQRAVIAASRQKYDSVAKMEEAAEKEIKEREEWLPTDELWDKVNAATKEILRHQHESGMITDEQYESVRDMFQFYVPLRGFADNTAEDMYSYYMNNSAGGFATPLRSAKGRKTRAESPLGWIGTMAESAIQADNKNLAKMKLYYALLNRPNVGVVSMAETWYEYTGQKDADGRKIYAPALPPATKGVLSAEQMRKHMDDWEESMREKQSQGLAYKGSQRVNLRGTVVFQDAKQDAEHVVRVKVAGKEYSILINGNPRAAQAINGLLNPEANAGAFMRGIGAVRRTMSSLLTSSNPLFWVGNYQRDMLSSMRRTVEAYGWKEGWKYANNRRKAWRVLSYIYKNENQHLGNSYYENLYTEFAENGGITGYTFITQNKEYEKMLEDYAKNVDRKIGKWITTAWDKTMMFGEAIEQVSRFAAYITAREAGMPIEEAINAAKEVSVNFNRKGSSQTISFEELDKLRTKSGKPLNPLQKGLALLLSGMPGVMKELYFFFNASIQALSSTKKLAKKSPGKHAAFVAMSFGASLALAVTNILLSGDDDDDEYMDLPDYLRRSNALIPVGDGIYLKWSIPQEMRPIYALADVIVSKMMGKAPHKNVGAEVALLAAEWLPVNPFGGEDPLLALVPDVLAPVAEIIANQNNFGGKIYNDMPWVSDEVYDEIPNYKKGTSKTGKVFVDIAEVLNSLSGGDEVQAGWLNINPAMVEHLVEGYGGGMYDLVKMIFSLASSPWSDEDIEIKDMPFVNKVLMSTDETNMNSHVNDAFYYYKGVADNAYRVEKEYRNSDDPDRADSYKEQEDWRIYLLYKQYEDDLEELDRQIKKSVDDTERDLLNQQRNALREKLLNDITQNAEPDPFDEYYHTEYKEVAGTLGEYNREIEKAFRQERDEDAEKLIDEMESYQRTEEAFRQEELMPYIKEYEYWKKERDIAIDPEKIREYEDKMLKARGEMLEKQKELDYLKPYDKKILMYRELISNTEPGSEARKAYQEELKAVREQRKNALLEYREQQ